MSASPGNRPLGRPRLFWTASADRRGDVAALVLLAACSAPSHSLHARWHRGMDVASLRSIVTRDHPGDTDFATRTSDPLADRRTPLRIWVLNDLAESSAPTTHKAALAQLGPTDALLSVLELGEIMMSEVPDRRRATGIYEGAPEDLYPYIGEVNNDVCFKRANSGRESLVPQGIHH